MKLVWDVYVMERSDCCMRATSSFQPGRAQLDERRLAMMRCRCFDLRHCAWHRRLFGLLPPHYQLFAIKVSIIFFGSFVVRLESV